MSVSLKSIIDKIHKREGKDLEKLLQEIATDLYNVDVRNEFRRTLNYGEKRKFDLFFKPRKGFIFGESELK